MYLNNIFVIDLAGGRLFTAGVITDLEVVYFAPRPVHVRDDVPFVFLHVVNIKQNLAGRAIDAPAYFVGLIGRTQETDPDYRSAVPAPSPARGVRGFRHPGAGRR